MNKNIQLLFILILLTQTALSQTVNQLIKNYSGDVEFSQNEKTVTFLSSGTIYFADKVGNGNNSQKDQMQNFWDVPKDVAKIVIKKDVRVVGAFHTFATCEITGEDRKTSVVYGADAQRWADKNNPGAQDLDEWYYAQFQNYGGTLTIKNLTSLNPFSYHVRGWGTIIHVDNCEFIDKRGGSGNHSDGFCGGNGSTVSNCYYETGDDVFKAYFDYTVTNCTINMVDNAVPIQLGWGNYSNGAKVDFYNLTITGNSGRWSPDKTYGVIVGRNGTYKVTVNINGLKIDNPNAHLVMLWQEGMTLEGEIINADINLKAYTQPTYNKGVNNLTICGSKEHKNNYNCLITGFELPGKLEAESYFSSTLEKPKETSDIDGEYELSPINSTDEIQYEIIVPEAGEYKIDYRIAANENCKFEVYLDNEFVDAVSSPISSWNTVSSDTELDFGQHFFTIKSKSNNWKLNWISFEKNPVLENITNLSARIQSKNSIELNWLENIGNETGFTIERKTDDDLFFQVHDTIPANINSYIDSIQVEPFVLYNYRIRTLFDNQKSQASAPVSARTFMAGPAPLEEGWQSINFGDTSVAMASSSTFNDGTFYIDAGDGDFWTEKDRGHFIYQTIKGDCEIVAFLDNYTHAQAFTMAGLMIRETLEQGSKYGAMMMMSTPGPIVRDRKETNGLVNQLPYSESGEQAPVWLRLKRVGNLFSGYMSLDGINWQLIRSVQINMNEEVFIGMAATSHTVESTAQFSFKDVVVTDPRAEFTIQTNSGSGGNITPSGSLTVLGGIDLTFSIQNNNSYQIEDVTVDDTSIGAVTTYTFTNISANHTIEATFKQNAFTITASAGENGSITPGGEITVEFGTNKSFYFSPETGYKVHDVLIDGKSKGSFTSYTFSNVTENHSIQASFIKEGTVVNEWNQANVKIYPNPFKNQIFVEGQELKTVQVYNLLGNLIHLEDKLSKANTLDLSTQKNGVYILKITNNKAQILIQPILKQ